MRRPAITYFDQVIPIEDGHLAQVMTSTIPTAAPIVDVSSTLTAVERDRLLELINQYQGSFSSASRVGQTPLTKHRIITDVDARPIRQNPYRVAPKERESIQRQVKTMLEDSVIRQCNSPWSSPVVLVKKKDVSLCFCVDYPKLNQVSKKDVYPLLRIDDFLDKLRNACYFSAMDLKSGYWQIEVDERDHEKTAFVTPDALYEFQVLPFGFVQCQQHFSV